MDRLRHSKVRLSLIFAEMFLRHIIDVLAEPILSEKLCQNLLSDDVAVIQCITSCHKNHITT